MKLEEEKQHEYGFEKIAVIILTLICAIPCIFYLVFILFSIFIEKSISVGLGGLLFILILWLAMGIFPKPHNYKLEK